MITEEEITPEQKPTKQAASWRETALFILDIVINAIVIIGVAWLIKATVITPFRVVGESMVPTLEDNDFIIVDKISYRFATPQRGNIVIVHPRNKKDFFVKRIIGLPGERISFKEGKVFIYNDQNPEGFELGEDYLSKENGNHTYLPDRVDKMLEIPADHYFLLGDNRLHSSDSRAWQVDDTTEEVGALPRSAIVGRAWLIVWPPQELRILFRPAYL